MTKKPSYEELEKRVQELSENQDKYELLAETIVHGVQEVDTTGKILYANSAFHKMCGYENGDLIGKLMYDLFPKDADSKALRDYIKILIQKQPEPEPWFGKMIMKNGNLFDVQIDWNYKLNRHGDIIGFISSISNIIEKIEAAKALKKEIQFRNTLIEALPYPTMLIKKNRTIVFANKVAHDIGARVGGICWQDFGHSDYIPEKDKDYINQHKTTKGLCSHCTFCLADEALSDLKPLVAPEVEAFGKIFETYWVPVSSDLFLHYALDITENKQAEQELKYSKLQLEAVFNNLDAIIYITDMDSYEILYMNNYMKEVLGKDSTGKICWKSFHENQDGPCDFCTNDKLIDADGDPTEPYVWEFYNSKVNKWYELHDQAIPWTDGRLVRMEIAVDISERKFSEEAALKREQYINSLNNAAQVLLGSIDAVPFQEFVDKIGPASNASRTYIFINYYGPEGCMMTSQEAEWCAKGITSQIDNPKLQNLSLEEWPSRWIEILTQGNIVKGRVADFPNNEREILEPQGILAIMIIPIMVEDMFAGFIGFDNCESDREWGITEEIFLSMASNGLAQAFKRIDFQEQIQSSLKEKEALLKEIHHRVKNNMQVIVSLLKMHGRRTEDKQLGAIFEDCRDRINAMSLIHESLYQSEDLAKIDFEIYLKKLCKNLDKAYDATSRKISLKVQQCDVTLNMDQGIAIGMVIAELVSNSFKHAFPTGKGGSVSISLSNLDENEVELIIQDSGRGLPEDFDIMNTQSLGLKLVVAAVTRELAGSIRVGQNNGTCFIIHFKGNK